MSAAFDALHRRAVKLGAIPLKVAPTNWYKYEDSLYTLSGHGKINPNAAPQNVDKEKLNDVLADRIQHFLAQGNAVLVGVQSTNKPSMTFALYELNSVGDAKVTKATLSGKELEDLEARGPAARRPQLPAPRSRSPQLPAKRSTRSASRASGGLDRVQRLADAKGQFYARLEFFGETGKGNASSKFWSMERNAAGRVRITWGRVGSAGTHQTIGIKEAMKRAAEKTGKGYVVVQAGSKIPQIR